MTRFLIVLLALWGTSCAPESVLREARSEGSFYFCALGDMPYYLPQDYKRFDNVIDVINAENPAFTVHVGDTKSGGTPCSDESVQRTAKSFSRFQHPLIYTPGDNEWTDCNREPAGSMDPLERLAVIRERFFSTEFSLGGGSPIKLAVQSEDLRFRKFTENRMWNRSNIVFATLHIVGSHNNNQPDVSGAVEEFLERDQANEAWLAKVFDEARNRDAPGIAIFIHGNPFGERRAKEWDPGHERFLRQLRELAISFKKPVLVSHGDSHYFRMDKPLMHEGGARVSVENLTRLEVFGAGNMHAVRVDVDPESRSVFRVRELIVEKNRK